MAPSSHSRHSWSLAWQSVTSLAAQRLTIARRWPFRLRHVTPESHSCWPRRTFLGEKLVLPAVLLYLIVSTLVPIPYLLWTKRHLMQRIAGETHGGIC